MSGKFEAIFVGYLQLPEIVNFLKFFETITLNYFLIKFQHLKGNNFIRKANFEIEPLKIRATIEIVPPSIQVEYIRNDSILFEAKIEDLIMDSNVIKIFN